MSYQRPPNFFYLVVVFCLGDISADEDDPLKAADPSSPNIQGEPVSIEEVPGETWRGEAYMLC